MTVSEEILRKLLMPVKPLPIVDWCEEYYYVDKLSPKPGRWRKDSAPWMIQPMEDFKNKAISQIILKWAAQVTGKTEWAKMCLTWTICNDPGPAMWILPAADECKTFAKTRLKDSWERTEPIRKLLPDDRTDNGITEVNFPETSFILTGANSGSKLTGKPVRFIFGDEIKDWPEGAWEVVKTRTVGFGGSSKCIGFSTPYESDDDICRAFDEGNQCHWHINCPHCNHSQEILWENIEFDTSLKTEDGRYKFNEIYKTIWISCAKCKGRMAGDDAYERALLLKTGHWVAYNNEAPADKKSYTINAIANPDMALYKLVDRYLRAKEAETSGVIKPLKDFYNQVLARGWDDAINVKDLKTVEIVSEDWKTDYTIGTVDVQDLDIYYALACDWSKAAGAKYKDFKKCIGWGEVQEFMGLNVIKPGRVFLDMAHHKSDVLRECSRYGWRALWGSDKDFFTWREKQRNGGIKLIKRVISEEWLEDPAMGTRQQGQLSKVSCMYWSNPSVKDICDYMLKKGKFVIPSAASEEFKKHMVSETKRKNDKGDWQWLKIGQRANHGWDCANMQVAVAIRAGLLTDVLPSNVIPELEIKSVPMGDTAEVAA